MWCLSNLAPLGQLPGTAPTSATDIACSSAGTSGCNLTNGTQSLCCPLSRTSLPAQMATSAASWCTRSSPCAAKISALHRFASSEILDQGAHPLGQPLLQTVESHSVLLSKCLLACAQQCLAAYHRPHAHAHNARLC